MTLAVIFLPAIFMLLSPCGAGGGGGINRFPPEAASNEKKAHVELRIAGKRADKWYPVSNVTINDISLTAFRF
jgi:hypothetical protein